MIIRIILFTTTIIIGLVLVLNVINVNAEQDKFNYSITCEKGICIGVAIFYVNGEKIKIHSNPYDTRMKVFVDLNDQVSLTKFLKEK